MKTSILFRFYRSIIWLVIICVVVGSQAYHTRANAQISNQIYLPMLMRLGRNIYFVDAISGSDANYGTSRDHAWRTIQKATNTLRTGDIAIVLAGTYNEEVKISTSGITLQAEGKVITKGVYITGNSNIFRGFTITDRTSDWGIRTSGNYNLVEGNEIYQTQQDGIWYFGSYNTFRGNYIHDILADDSITTHSDCFQTWSWDWDTTNVLFENNTCINNELVNTNNEFAYIYRDVTRLKPDGTTALIRDITFRNNVFVIYKPIWSALGLKNVSNITFVNNTIVNMGQSKNNTASSISGLTDISFINNAVVNFGDKNSYQPYIIVDGGTNINVHHNSIYNTNGIPPYKGPYPNDLWMIDPKFVNLSNLDFHLQPNSPLCTAGTNGTYIGAYPCP